MFYKQIDILIFIKTLYTKEKKHYMITRIKFFEFFSYYLQFEARKLLSVKGDVAIDDIAMSPKCFGLGKCEQ